MAPGVRSKFGAPMFEPEVFRKQMYCTEVLVTLLGLFGAFMVIRRPGNCASSPPSLRPWLPHSATRLNKSWHTALIRGIQDLGEKTFQFARIFAPLWGKRIGEFCRAMVLLEKLAQTYREVFPEFFLSCPNLPPLRTPTALAQKLWQKTSYLELSGLNNWFYVVIKIFAEHLDICSPKLVEWRSLLPPPGYASGKSYWWLCGFEPFVAIANP